MSEYHREIEEYRIKFAAVDRKDPKSLRRFFDRYPHLRTTDMALIVERDTNYVRSLRILAGLGKPPVKHRPTNPNRKIINIKVPENWDNEKWLRRAAALYSTLAISKAIGVSRRTILRRFEKYGIKAQSYEESMRPNNPCCNKAWVHKHYVEDRLSQTECARLAGITRAGFTKWLVRFKIAVRTPKETYAKRKTVTIWPRELLHKLNDQPIVRKCYVRDDHIHVRFMNYFWETYYLNKPATNKANARIPRSYGITRKEAKLESVPPVIQQYESDFDRSYPAHIVIPRDKWDAASFIEQRLAVHEFARQMTQRGWIDPNYPQHIIDAEWDKLKNINSARYLRKSTFTAFPCIGTQAPPGRRLVENYFDFNELWDVIRSPRWTMNTLNSLTSKKLQIDTHNFYRTMMAEIRKPMPRMVDPGLYIVLFKRLGITGKILDLTPNHGSRAVASAINGITYCTLPNEKVQKAINKGLCEQTGLNYEEYDDGKVDLVMIDNDLRECDIELAMEYASKAKRIMAFVPRNKKSIIASKYKPSSIIQIKARFFRKTPDFLFIW